MKADMSRYFVMAALGSAAVYYGSAPDAEDGSLDNIVTVYGNGGKSSAHSTVRHVGFQAVIRNTDYEAGEDVARTLWDAVNGVYGLALYDGLYLSAPLYDTARVPLVVDDGAGIDRAEAFSGDDYVLIDDEIVRVTGVSGSIISVRRAMLGTTLAFHQENTAVANISRVPVPGTLCGSCVVDDKDVLELGRDEKNRWEFSLNWTVTVAE